MRGAVLYGGTTSGSEEIPEPGIVESTDAIVRIAATCVCGSDPGTTAASTQPPKKPVALRARVLRVVEAVRCRCHNHQTG